MSGDPLRLGIVGCGRLAEAGYAPASARVSGLRVTAVADPDPARRTQVASLLARRPTHEVAEFADASSMLEAGAVDAVVLANPVVAHVTDATLAVEAGVPVLVEKPPAVDSNGTDRLRSLGPLVRLGFNRRFDHGARRVRSLIPTDGPLDLHLEIAYRRASWGALAVRDEILLDLVPHLVDWARWLTASEVAAVTTGELGHERARIDLALDRGTATIVAAGDRIHREHIEVRRPDGNWIARHRVGGLLPAVLGRVRRHGDAHPLEESLAEQLRAFARVVRGEQDDALATASDGHAVMTVIDAARRSAASGGRTVPVHDPSESSPC